MSRTVVRVLPVAALLVAVVAVTPTTVALMNGDTVSSDVHLATTLAFAIVLAAIEVMVLREIHLLGRVGRGTIVEVHGAPSDGSAVLESDAGLRRLGFSPIGRLEFLGFGPAPVHHTKYASPAEPFISVSVVEERRRTLFWSVWTDGRTLTSVTPSIGGKAWPRTTVQSTNAGIDAAYQLHISRLASIGNGAALERLATIPDVLAANQLEQATLTVAARGMRRRRLVVAGILAVVWLAVLATGLLT